MSRKKRRFEQLEAAAAANKEKKIYVNPLQKKVDEKLEDVERKLAGKGRTVIYIMAGVVIVAIIAMIVVRMNRSSNATAQAALGKAIELSQSRVTDTPPLAGSTEKTFKTEKERAEASIAEFQAVADKFGGAVSEKARFFIAVNRLVIDRQAGIQELEGLANASSDVGKLAKFALAQTRAEDGKADEAIALYQELAAMDDPLVAKETVNFELAKLYEKQGRKQEAVDIYYNIAKSASEAKDLDGKPVTMTETAKKAKQNLQQLEPNRAKEIAEPAPDNPFGGGPIGM